jgi:hypothetical protein
MLKNYINFKYSVQKLKFDDSMYFQYLNLMS